MRRTIHWITLVLVAQLLASCGTLPISSKNYEAGAPIPPGHGLMAVHLHSNWNPKDKKDFKQLLYYTVRPAAHPNTGFFNIHVDKLDKQRLIPVPAGRYYFATLKMGSDYLILNKKSTFDIKAGQITYVGDLYTKIYLLPVRAQIWTRALPEQEKQYLQANYPALLPAMTFKTELVQPRPKNSNAPRPNMPRNFPQEFK